MNAITVDITPAGSQTIDNRFPSEVSPKVRLNDRDSYVAAAQALLPVLRKHSVEAARLRRPVDAVVETLVEAGLVNAMRPRSYGGAGLELSEMVEIGAILAEGCASTAWVWVVWEVHNWMIGMLDKPGQDEVFGAHPVVLCCGASNPSRAQARAAEGGFVVQGRWGFGSGSTHANWASVFAIIEGQEIDGRPDVRMMLVPRPQFAVEDAWNTMALAGTGSHDIVIGQEVFVPFERSAMRKDIAGGTGPGAKLHPETASYAMPLPPGAHLATGASAIGLAKATIEGFVELTKSRTHVTGKKQIDVPASAIRIGKGLVDIDAARMLLVGTLRELEAELRAGRALTTPQRAKARMVAGYVPDLCKQVVESVVSASGASGMFAGSRFAEALLDVNMMSLHQSTEYDRGPENYGRVVLGLEPSNLAI